MTLIILILSVILLFSSCGTTRATAKISEYGNASITITTNNPTQVDVSNRVDSLKFKIK